VMNSVIISVGATVICLAVAALAGYSLSALRWSRVTTGILLGISALLQLIPPMTLVPGPFGVRACVHSLTRPTVEAVPSAPISWHTPSQRPTARLKHHS